MRGDLQHIYVYTLSRNTGEFGLFLYLKSFKAFDYGVVPLFKISTLEGFKLSQRSLWRVLSSEI
jgi:hypothetical protein